MTNRSNRLAASSRDSHLALRRVERQHALIERLHAAHGRRVRLEELAGEFAVSKRTIARDVERLRLSGVPLRSHRGRGGGVSMVVRPVPAPIVFDLPELAALMSSLTCSVPLPARTPHRPCTSWPQPWAPSPRNGSNAR